MLFHFMTVCALKGENKHCCQEIVSRYLVSCRQSACWPRRPWFTALSTWHRELQAVTRMANALRGSQEAALWCKERAARAGDRAAALVPALLELERAVLAPGQGVDVRLVESLSVMLLLLAKVGL
jgi:hypothetical protein